MIVRIKVCGITQLEDALAAVEAGASALGFMFYDRSPRCISFEAAEAIIRRLPPFVARVGVFVNPSIDDVQSAIARCGLDTIQLHGDETPEFCASVRLPVIKAFRMKDSTVMQTLNAYASVTAAWLLDSYVPGQLGGTGATFNWALAAQAVRLGHPVILAGGLTPDNVAEAIRQVRPYGVDVSSGVESSPGRKDPTTLQAFARAVITASSQV